MANQIKLTWIKDQKCWAKFYKGKRHYLSPRGTKKTDKAAYEAAVEKWFQIRAGHDPNLDTEPDEKTSVKVATAHSGPTSYDAGLWDDEAAKQDAAVFASNYFASDFAGTTTVAAKGEIRIPVLMETYLAERQALVDNGKLTVQSWRDTRDKLADFLGACQAAKRLTLDKIDRPFLKGYKAKQEELCGPKAKGDRISPHTARKRLQFTRMFFEWLEAEEYIETCPSILNRKFASIDLPKPTPKFWAVDEVKTLWKFAPQIPFGKADENGDYHLLRLCIALGLNCAYAPGDIATLRHSHIDFKNGVIFRERNKTGQLQVAKLWTVTRKLLELCMTEPDKDEDGGGLVLYGSRRVGPKPTTREGRENDDRPYRPLVWDHIWTADEAAAWNEAHPDSKAKKKTGLTVHCDTVSRSFNRLLHLVEGNRKRFDRDGRSFKHLRKSTPQQIFEHYKNETLADLLMGHRLVQNGVNQHYLDSGYVTIKNAATCGHFDELFEACGYLEELYGLEL